MTVLLRVVLALALLAVVVYGVWEVRRWGTPLGRDMISPRQRRLRAIGLALTLLALGLWLRGLWLPDPHSRLALARYLGYWTLTALCAVALLPVALLDARENLRRAIDERRHLKSETVGLHE